MRMNCFWKWSNGMVEHNLLWRMVEIMSRVVRVQAVYGGRRTTGGRIISWGHLRISLRFGDPRSANARRHHRDVPIRHVRLAQHNRMMVAGKSVGVWIFVRNHVVLHVMLRVIAGVQRIGGGMTKPIICVSNWYCRYGRRGRLRCIVVEQVSNLHTSFGYWR